MTGPDEVCKCEPTVLKNDLVLSVSGSAKRICGLIYYYNLLQHTVICYSIL